MLVLKIGGSLGKETDRILDDLVAHRSRTAEACVLVHGGSQEIDALGARLGLPQRSIRSPQGSESRHTDKETLAVVLMALAGSLNPALVDALIRKGETAIGLSGIDGRLVVAARKQAIRALVDGRICLIRDSHTGRIQSINHDLLQRLIAAGYLPVLSPPAIDLEHGPVNVDADRMAAAVAAALAAPCLVLLTNTAGLLADPADPCSLIPLVKGSELEHVRPCAKGRMKLKVLAVEEALQRGVARVIIADGRVGQPLTAALRGGGTHFTNDQCAMAGA